MLKFPMWSSGTQEEGSSYLGKALLIKMREVMPFKAQVQNWHIDTATHISLAKASLKLMGKSMAKGKDKEWRSIIPPEKDVF